LSNYHYVETAIKTQSESKFALSVGTSQLQSDKWQVPAQLFTNCVVDIYEHFCKAYLLSKYCVRLNTFINFHAVRLQDIHLHGENNETI